MSSPDSSTLPSVSPPSVQVSSTPRQSTGAETLLSVAGLCAAVAVAQTRPEVPWYYLLGCIVVICLPTASPAWSVVYRFLPSGKASPP